MGFFLLSDFIWHCKKCELRHILPVDQEPQFCIFCGNTKRDNFENLGWQYFSNTPQNLAKHPAGIMEYTYTGPKSKRGGKKHPRRGGDYDVL